MIFLIYEHLSIGIYCNYRETRNFDHMGAKSDNDNTELEKKFNCF